MIFHTSSVPQTVVLGWSWRKRGKENDNMLNYMRHRANSVSIITEKMWTTKYHAIRCRMQRRLIVPSTSRLGSQWRMSWCALQLQLLSPSYWKFYWSLKRQFKVHPSLMNKWTTRRLAIDVGIVQFVTLLPGTGYLQFGRRLQVFELSLIFVFSGFDLVPVIYIWVSFTFHLFHTVNWSCQSWNTTLSPHQGRNIYGEMLSSTKFSSSNMISLDHQSA